MATDAIPAAGLLALIPMLIFGVLYLVLLIAFAWGFFSMVRSQKRVAAAQEETLNVLKEAALTLRAWSNGPAS